jgi:hypothetical protein
MSGRQMRQWPDGRVTPVYAVATLMSYEVWHGTVQDPDVFVVVRSLYLPADLSPTGKDCNVSIMPPVAVCDTLSDARAKIPRWCERSETALDDDGAIAWELWT